MSLYRSYFGHRAAIGAMVIWIVAGAAVIVVSLFVGNRPRLVRRGEEQ